MVLQRIRILWLHKFGESVMSDTVLDSLFVDMAMKTIRESIKKALSTLYGESQIPPTYGSAIDDRSFVPQFETLAPEQVRAKVRELIDDYLGQMLRQGQIKKPTTICRSAVGCVVRQLRHGPVVGFNLNDGDVIKCKRKFYGRRKARVFSRHGWKGVLFADMTFMPVRPIEYITLDVMVTRGSEPAFTVKEVADAFDVPESMITDDKN